MAEKIIIPKYQNWLSYSIKARNQIKKLITIEEKLKLLEGMLLTRATDNALKHMFLSGEIKYQDKNFQGKGFRSLGQEAIYGAALKLDHGEKFYKNGQYVGDIAAPLIRDLGFYLGFNGHDVVSALNAQAAKSGAPSDGRDLHLGDFSQGLLMAAAPLAIATCSLIGMALAFKLKNQRRVALSFIGEGGTSLGEWHEAINFAAVHQLPMIFCIQNNQTALSTPTHQQNRAKTFADKALGYGMRSLVIDGNDVCDIAATFKFAADECRLGQGPILLELQTMRMCGHAHHDDMLYLGQDPKLDFELPKLKKTGYADTKLYEKWRKKDPIALFEQKILKEKISCEQDISYLKKQILSQVNKALDEVKSKSWPVLKLSDEELVYKSPIIFTKPAISLSKNFIFNSHGSTYLQAIAEGTRRSFLRHPSCLVIGEDVAAPYGNAFMLFKNIMDEFKHRFLNTPISENAIVGACVGLALSGMRPIGEMQFNDFVACAMNQVVNNAAKNYFRTGLNVPMVLRMPFGGMRRAGPFHSQDTSPWFYRISGLKIMAPSTPIDAMHMLIKAVDDPDPVLFFEHIALYREPKIKQDLTRQVAYEDLSGAALVNVGKDISIITYGAYVHVAIKVANILVKKHGKSADVIDLRYLKPIDFATCYESIKKCGRALLVGEDAKTGSILESIASNIGQHCFKYLDAPVVVLGSRDIPVPYSPALEDDYLLSEAEILEQAFRLLNF